MNFNDTYKSPIGYQLGEDGVDSLGVDHKNFSLHDEVQYQFNLADKTNQIINAFNSMGIYDNYPQIANIYSGNMRKTDNSYPQCTVDNSAGGQSFFSQQSGVEDGNSSQVDSFTGNSSGFPATNSVSENSRLTGNGILTTADNSQSGFDDMNSCKMGFDFNSWLNSLLPQTCNYNIKPRIWESAADGKQVYNYVLGQEGNYIPTDQNILNYLISSLQGSAYFLENFSKIRKMNVTDKYKHALMNCNAAQYGQGGVDIGELLSDLREWNDKRTGANTLDSSEGDQYANKIGRLLGAKYPEEDCDELVQKYIKKNW